VGLALNFIINRSPIVIPMVIEEPSVVAAVSGAAKTICSNGQGFSAITSEKSIIFAQVLLLDVHNPKEAAKKVRFPPFYNLIL
jgi:hydroxymethylglutaryl-CoA reductase